MDFFVKFEFLPHFNSDFIKKNTRPLTAELTERAELD